MKHLKITWILRGHHHQHHHFIDEGTKTRKAVSLWLWTCQWCLYFLFYLDSFFSFLFLSVFLSSFSASIAKRTHVRRRVTSAQSVYCHCIFSLSRFLIKHLFNSFYLHFSSQSWKSYPCSSYNIGIHSWILSLLEKTLLMIVCNDSKEFLVCNTDHNTKK